MAGGDAAAGRVLEFAPVVSWDRKTTGENPAMPEHRQPERLESGDV